MDFKRILRLLALPSQRFVATIPFLVGTLVFCSAERILAEEATSCTSGQDFAQVSSGVDLQGPDDDLPVNTSRQCALVADIVGADATNWTPKPAPDGAPLSKRAMLSVFRTCMTYRKAYRRAEGTIMRPEDYCHCNQWIYDEVFKCDWVTPSDAGAIQELLHGIARGDCIGIADIHVLGNKIPDTDTWEGAWLHAASVAGSAGSSGLTLTDPDTHDSVDLSHGQDFMRRDNFKGEHNGRTWRSYRILSKCAVPIDQGPLPVDNAQSDGGKPQPALDNVLN